jgi:hypothetical protein
MSDEVFLGSVKRQIVGTVCPKCGKPADGGTGMEYTRDPKPGDWAVCLYCGALNRYDDRLRLYLPSRQERRRLARDPRLRRLLEIAEFAARGVRRTWQ